MEVVAFVTLFFMSKSIKESRKMRSGCKGTFTPILLL